jgi:hypothetical protein
MKKVLIFFIFFTLIEFQSIAQIAQRIDNIEVKNEFLIFETWHNVIKYVIAKGDGWRIPTFSELELIYDNKNTSPFILNKIYFSSYKGLKLEEAVKLNWLNGPPLCLNMVDGKAKQLDINTKANLILVRDYIENKENKNKSINHPPDLLSQSVQLSEQLKVKGINYTTDVLSLLANIFIAYGGKDTLENIQNIEKHSKMNFNERRMNYQSSPPKIYYELSQDYEYLEAINPNKAYVSRYKESINVFSSITNKDQTWQNGKITPNRNNEFEKAFIIPELHYLEKGYDLRIIKKDKNLNQIILEVKTNIYPNNKRNYYYVYYDTNNFTRIKKISFEIENEYEDDGVPDLVKDANPEWYAEGKIKYKSKKLITSYSEFKKLNGILIPTKIEEHYPESLTDLTIIKKLDYVIFNLEQKDVFQDKTGNKKYKKYY